MWLMDSVTIRDFRARDIRILQINSQNFRVRKIWKTWFLDIGAFSWQNATYTIQFILTIYINSEKLMLPGRCAPVDFFSWKCGKLRKTAKNGYCPFRTSLFSALSWNKISHMNLQSLKILKTTKDMFYKQFVFFANWQGRLWGFVNLVLWLWLVQWFFWRRCLKSVDDKRTTEACLFYKLTSELIITSLNCYFSINIVVFINILDITNN